MRSILRLDFVFRKSALPFGVVSLTNRLMKRLIYSLLLLSFFPFSAGAQMHHELGLMAGVANYYGDLQTETVPAYGYKPMGGILYKFFLSPHVGFRFGASFAQLTAADSLSNISVNRARHLSFATNLFEFHGGIELNLLPIDVDRMKVTPYVFGGIGVFYANPYTTAQNGDKLFLRPLSTEGQGLSQYPDRKEYNLVNVSFPVGGGFKFLIGKALVITTEVGVRYTSTDYLDDVSRSFVNLDTLQAFRGAQASQISFRGDEVPNWDGTYPSYRFQRGDSKANDWYYFAGINVAVYFSVLGNVKEYIQTKCPSFFPGRARNYYR